ncbi:hypothetical protein HCN44_011032 [Aphidius gifuensis]|uniref:Uncharacterized protein n=1 Tax=Aphidius gifuensis TaxID=684658 RepID=A0A835CW11_APHGI|nr:hypothetical protein HCN44_011032 [Aphidius gifuensis]
MPIRVSSITDYRDVEKTACTICRHKIFKALSISKSVAQVQCQQIDLVVKNQLTHNETESPIVLEVIDRPYFKDLTNNTNTGKYGQSLLTPNQNDIVLLVSSTQGKPLSTPFIIQQTKN